MQGRENLNNPLERLDLKYNPVCLDDGTLKNWYERIVVFDKGEHVLFPFFFTARSVLPFPPDKDFLNFSDTFWLRDGVFQTVWNLHANETWDYRDVLEQP